MSRTEARPRLDRKRIDALVEWMGDGAPPSANAREIVRGICDGVVAAGIRIDRFALFIFTLHPLVHGRRFLWRRGEDVLVTELPHQMASTPQFRATIANQVMTTGAGRRVRLRKETDALGFPDLIDLRDEGMTDYLIEPLRYTTGETHAASWTTAAPRGFSEAAIGALKRLSPPLARITETYVVRFNAAHLLSAYVGRNAGGRILAGQIQRGDAESIEAVILFLDVKGYTTLSNTLPPDRVVELLNAFYDQVVPPIEAQGGEVLKFMGDGLIATFPTEMGPDGAMAALGALHEAERRLSAANAERIEAGEEPIGYRAALHIGRVLYGNVGARHRLDFTVIGPAVNLGARLLGVASAEGLDWVCSEPFAALSPTAKRSLGQRDLKGFAAPQRIFSLEKPG